MNGEPSRYCGADVKVPRLVGTIVLAVTFLVTPVAAEAPPAERLYRVGVLSGGCPPAQAESIVK